LFKEVLLVALDAWRFCQSLFADVASSRFTCCDAIWELCQPCHRSYGSENLDDAASAINDYFQKLDKDYSIIISASGPKIYIKKKRKKEKW